jgi:hypothetical protein
VVEATGIGHRGLQRVLPRMSEGRMANIVGEAERFSKILVQRQRPGQRSPNLRDFQAVGEANPKVIAVGRDEDLCLVAEAPERDGMDDPIAVALERIARPPRLADTQLIVKASPRFRRVGRVAGQRPHCVASFTIS